MTSKKATIQRGRVAHVVRSKAAKGTPRKAAKTAFRKPTGAATQIPSHERTTPSGLILPGSFDDSLVPPSKLRQGLKKASLEIQNVLGDLVSMMTEEYSIAEIELSASFSADGKFLGFGVGGDASIKVNIRPAGR